MSVNRVCVSYIYLSGEIPLPTNTTILSIGPSRLSPNWLCNFSSVHNDGTLTTSTPSHVSDVSSPPKSLGPSASKKGLI